MLDSISDKTEQELFELKIKLSAINLAIRNAQRLKFDRSKVSSLYSMKANIIAEKKKKEFEALAELVTKDITLLSNGWMAIAYFKGNKQSSRQLFLTPLKDNISSSSVANILNKNPAHQPQEILKPLLDEQKLTLYRLQVNNKAIEILQSIIMEDNEENDREIITAHAFRRWCERILDGTNSNNLDVEERKVILQKIHEDFSKAILKYSQEETGKDFYLNENSMIIYCVKNHTIISLWKNDFGFSFEDINIDITLKQFDFINKKKQELKDRQIQLDEKIQFCTETLDDYNDKLEELKEEYQKIKERIKKKEKDIETEKNKILEFNNQKNNLEESLRKEEGILFKKFKPEAMSDDNDYSIMEDNLPDIKMDLSFAFNDENEVVYDENDAEFGLSEKSKEETLAENYVNCQNNFSLVDTVENSQTVHDVICELLPLQPSGK